MSQQYGGPPPGPPPAAAPGGWGAGTGGPGAGAPGGWGPGPGRPVNRPAKSGRTQLIVIGAAVLAVILVAVGVVLLVTGGDDKSAAPQTPNAPGTMYTPPAGSKPDDSKGPNDVGVEVGKGIWFTPAKGWLLDWDKTKAGKNYILQQFNVRGLIDGYYWVRQTELYDAKGFAEHLVDLESTGMQDVKIGKGVECKPANEAIKACYALNYTAKVKTSKGTMIDFQGFVTAYSDKWDRVTATDAALETRVYDRRKDELARMNASLEKSF
ncbi:hypothetical protein HPO96_00015 [Kribbella sandramycini]|uniref:Uncharacterized protein n=1 Tax=Kribbella sandramycini TaxID=60450 RepID=A0A7Y4KVG6_9ACTN|nr:hypothetical protein [Kribbella sandramycini]MBB6568798.1 hypothetical protein [Kribbella sandramycini]NOL38621.1 hypothetical protein [Kribbella sandramycini]